MLEINKKAASKFGIDARVIEENVDTKKNIEILGNDHIHILVNLFQNWSRFS